MRTAPLPSLQTESCRTIIPSAFTDRLLVQPHDYSILFTKGKEPG